MPGHEHGNWLTTLRGKAQPNPEEQEGKATEILRDFCGLFAFPPVRVATHGCHKQKNINAIPVNEGIATPSPGVANLI